MCETGCSRTGRRSAGVANLGQNEGVYWLGGGPVNVYVLFIQ